MIESPEKDKVSGSRDTSPVGPGEAQPDSSGDSLALVNNRLRKKILVRRALAKVDLPPERPSGAGPRS